MINISRTPPDDETLRREWDAIASLRNSQISSGSDISFNLVLAPLILGIARSRAPVSLALDIGCGTGNLSVLLATEARRVVGIDASSTSIAIAESAPHPPNVEFSCSTVDALQADPNAPLFDLCVSNMLLMNVPRIAPLLNKVRQLLTHRGIFVATCTHPCFWPQYWGYDKQPGFAYTEELFVNAPFRISAQETTLRTTHVHRPITQYVTELRAARFNIDEILEPWPSDDAQQRYPSRWAFPRFIAFVCTRT